MLLAGLPLILLPLLAVLQYRWIGEVSAAERDRLESSLRAASDRFASDFDGELSRLASSFQIRDGFPDSPAPLIERYQNWSETSPYAHLIRNLYVLKTSPGAEPEFERVDLQNGQFELAPLPPELQNIRERFRPGVMTPASGNSMMLVTTIFRRPRQFNGPRQEDNRTRGPEDFARNPRFGRGPRPGFGPGGPGGTGPGGPGDGALAIELDRDVLLKEMVPALVEKHFSHDETYRIAIVSQGDAPHILYSSAGEWKPEEIATPDAQVSLFGAPPPPPSPNGPGNNTGNRRAGRTRAPGPFTRNGVQATLISQPWALLAKHRAGSLEQAVDQVRRRDLAISFGILVVLAAGLITVVLSSQRAHTLGRLQMEFAAGISHELRTPLAVIRSAAYNLRSGVVRDKEGIEQYAGIVQEEARRLSDLVEEVLLYSETQSGRKKYKLEPIDVNEVLDRAITNLSPVLDLDKCEFTPQIDSDLPPVKADAGGLTQCLQNLLSNAYKYGKKDDKAEIEIVGQHDEDANEVRLSVIDHGRGIDAADQRHLFEPFYRGERVESNIPGNGLGLHLVKRIMQAQGGRVTFNPAPDGGACFTLHIPVAS